MRWAPPLFLGALLAFLTTLGLAMGEHEKVVNSDHDLGVSSGHSGVSSCEICHLPSDAGGEPLWPEGPYREGDTFSGIRPFCYSCHDGTVSPGGAYAFDESVAHHPITAGRAGDDCDMCHEPHESEFGNFLLFPAGANFCKSCHASASEKDHSVNVDTSEYGSAPQDARWDPDVGDYSGTRLWDRDGRQPGSYVKCLSCHAGHATYPDTPLLTMNPGGEGADSLCLNCHPPE